MIALFITTLFLTLLITRIFAHLFHDAKNYGTLKEKSKTLTFIFRKYTGIDVHHIHIGFILLPIGIILILINGVTSLSVLALSIGLSLIADQIVPLLNRKFNYFKKEAIISSLIIHIIISLVAISIYL